MKKLLQVISFVLVVTLILQIAPVTVSRVLASEAVDDSAPMMQTAEEAEIVCEEVEKREENVKHFRLSDGSYLAAQYDVPVHYEDENGVWQEYDNRLSLIENRSTEENQEYAVRSNDLELKLAKKAKAQNMFRVKNGAYELTWGYQGSNKSRIEVVETADDGDHLSLHNLYGESFYRNLYTNVDLQVLATPEGIKENLILKEASAQSSFVLNYHHAELTPVQIDSRTIVLRDAGGADVFWVTAPVVSDAEGKSSADAVTLTLGSTEDGKSVITLSVSDDWLADAVYPVAIDPTVNLSAGLSSRLTSYYVKKNGNSTMSYELLVSDQYRGFMQLDPITLGSTQRITNATLELFVMGGKAEAEIIDIHAVTSAWSGPFTWAEQPTHDATVLEQKAITSADTQTRVAFDVTKAVQNWMAFEADNSNGYANYGLMFRNHDETSTSGATISIGVVPFGTFGASARPSLTISYIYSTGIKSHFSYQSNAVGINGSGNIQDVTGNLVLQENVFSGTGNRLAASLTLTYNRNQKNVLDVEGGGVGYGWRLSSQQRFGIETLPGSAESIYYYIDGTGAKYYFVEDGTSLVDEEGIGLTLDPSVPMATMTDMSDNTMTFSYMLNKALFSVEDNEGDVLSYGYAYINGAARLDSIAEPTGRSLRFHYQSDSDFLVRSISYASSGTVKQIASFTYDANSRLQSITYADGGIVTYAEGTDASGSETLTVASNRSNVKTVYTFDGNGRVTRVQEYAGDTPGHYVTYEYDTVNQTKCTDYNGNTVCLRFDAQGRTVSTLTADGMSENAEYDNSGSVQKTNKMTAVSQISGHSTNLLLNGGFENAANDWSVSQEATSVIQFLSGTLSDIPGKYLLKFVNSSTAKTAYCYQNVDLTGRDATHYTASVYVSTENVASSTNGGADLKLGFYDANGVLLHESSAGAVSGTFDCHRIFVTAEKPAGAVTARVSLGMEDATGTIKFDSVQLEEGRAANLYDYLQNGDFSKTSGWTAVNKESSDGYISNGGYKLNGKTDTGKYIHQFVEVDSTLRPFYFVVSAQGDLLPEAGNADSIRGAYICVRFVYEKLNANEALSAYTEDQVAYFNDFDTEMQTISVMATPTRTDRYLQRIRVSIHFADQANAFIIQKATLYSEGYGLRCSYNADGLLTESVDTNGETYNRVYDNDYNIVEEGDGQTTTKMNYNLHRMTSSYSLVKDNGVADYYFGTNYTYDNFGNIVKQSVGVTGENGVIQSGQQIQSSATYTSDGNYPVSSTNEMGHTTSYIVDYLTGLPQSVTAPNGVTADYIYRDNSSVLTAVSAGGITNSYHYDDLGRLAGISHNDTNYTFAYDAWDLLSTVKVASRPLATHTYNADRFMSRTTYENGGYFDYTYDDRGLVTEITGDNGYRLAYDFDHDGRLFRQIDGLMGTETVFEYNSEGNLVKSRTTGDRSVESKYLYDDFGNLLNQTTKIGEKTFAYTATYRDDGTLSSINAGSNTASYSYDLFGRLSRVTKTDTGFAGYLATKYTYKNWTDSTGANRTSNLVSREEFMVNSNTAAKYLWYDYDVSGNLIRIGQGSANTLKASYTYDLLGRLTRENNVDSGKTTVYTYDDGGNILSKVEYTFTTAVDLSALTPLDTVTYTYGDSEWKDLLTAYDGQAITYDAVGNPLTYRDGMSFSWINGRTLASITRGNDQIAFGYGADGLRTSKIVNGKETEFYYDDSGRLLLMTDGTDTLEFGYDITSGSLEGFAYNGTKYTYVYNTRGDVIGLYQIFGAQTDFLVSYEYDAWGNLISIIDFQGNDLTNDTTSALGKIAHLNPFRYRGYFYDVETGFYFLQSRYYDPTTHRFINSDAVEYLGANGDMNAYNLFSYCSNNPVMHEDETGHTKTSLQCWPRISYTVEFAINAYRNIVLGISGWVNVYAHDRVPNDPNHKYLLIGPPYQKGGWIFAHWVEDYHYFTIAYSTPMKIKEKADKDFYFYLNWLKPAVWMLAETAGEVQGVSAGIALFITLVDSLLPDAPPVYVYLNYIAANPQGKNLTPFVVAYHRTEGVNK